MAGQKSKLIRNAFAVQIIFALFLHRPSIVDGAINFPDGLQACKKNDPNLNVCVKKLLDSLISHAEKGVPELDLPPFDPLFVPEMTIMAGDKNGKNHVTFYNSSVSGLKRLQIRKLGVDLPKLAIQVSAFVAHAEFQGTYDVDYQIMTFHAKGKGPATGEMDDLDAKGVFKGELQVINGVKYLQVVDVVLEARLKRYKIKMEKLFADPGANNAFNNLVNNPAMKDSPIVKKVIAGVGSNTVKEWMNMILKRLPFDELLVE